MIVMVLFLALVSAYFVAKGLSQTGAEVSAQRDQRSRDALLQAKAGLIAFAADTNFAAAHSTQPGSLPCPDTNNDGDAEGTCNSISERIGRLPWKTLNLPDLRDDSGERLWYAVSGNFRKAPGTTIINSNTQGTIAINGSAPATGVLAVVIAPGQALQNQTRDAGHLNDPSSYLEGINAGANDDVFETRAPPNDRDPSTGDRIFNDRLVAITHRELFDMVEPIVANRLVQDGFVTDMQSYFTTWGRFPFATTFANPDSSNFRGVTGETSGLLPITGDMTYMTWSVNIVQLPNNPSPYQSTGLLLSTSCTDSSTSTTCTIDYILGRPRIRLTATAPAGHGFARRIQNTDISGSLASAVVRTTTPTLNASGNYTITYEGRVPSGGSTVITVQKPSYYTLTSSTPASTFWFVANQWHKLMYYAVAPSLLPGAGGDCQTTPPCLTVNNYPSGQSATVSNARAIIVLAGRALVISGTPQVRPSATLGNYLEGVNQSPANYIYENRTALGTANDRVIVVSP